MSSAVSTQPNSAAEAEWRRAGNALFATLDARVAGRRVTVTLVGRPETATDRPVVPAPTREARMSVDEARGLPYHFFRPVNTRERYRDHEGCVCLEDYRKCEHLIELPCGHRLHRRCGTKWLQESATCPYCRSHAAAAQQQR